MRDESAAQSILGMAFAVLAMLVGLFLLDPSNRIAMVGVLVLLFLASLAYVVYRGER